MAPKPNRSIVRQLRRIDPELEARWAEPPGRWAIYHSLPQLGKRVEDVADAFAREVQREYARAGHVLDLDDCWVTALEALQALKLVCYVTEDDGSYRPLDGRIIEKLQRMDSYRRNLGVKDWKQLLEARAYAAQQQRQRAGDAVWDEIRRDKVFERMLSDAIHGLRPVRSVIVPAGVPAS